MLLRNVSTPQWEFFLQSWAGHKWQPASPPAGEQHCVITQEEGCNHQEHLSICCYIFANNSSFPPSQNIQKSSIFITVLYTWKKSSCSTMLMNIPLKEAAASAAKQEGFQGDPADTLKEELLCEVPSAVNANQNVAPLLKGASPEVPNKAAVRTDFCTVTANNDKMSNQQDFWQNVLHTNPQGEQDHIPVQCECIFPYPDPHLKLPLLCAVTPWSLVNSTLPSMLIVPSCSQEISFLIVSAQASFSAIPQNNSKGLFSSWLDTIICKYTPISENLTLFSLCKTAYNVRNLSWWTQTGSICESPPFLPSQIHRVSLFCLESNTQIGT